jgi:hypothetical protein
MVGGSAFHDERETIPDHEHQARHGKEDQGASKGDGEERDAAGGVQQKSKNKNLAFRAR